MCTVCESSRSTGKRALSRNFTEARTWKDRERQLDDDRRSLISRNQLLPEMCFKSVALLPTCCQNAVDDDDDDDTQMKSVQQSLEAWPYTRE